MRKITFLFCGLLTLFSLIGINNLQAQAYTFTSANLTYSENFDGMGTSGTAFLTGWYGYRYAGSTAAGDLTTLVASTGTSTTGGCHNVGTAGGDRSIGLLASNSTIPRIGATFTNNTGGNITSLAFSFVMEQWRSASSNTVDEINTFEYSFDATSLSTGTWTAFTNLNLYELLTGTTTNTNVDGTASGNYANISATLSSITWGNGTTMWIRWNDDNAAGSDCLLSVDDLSITATYSAASPQPTNHVEDLDGSLSDPATMVITWSENDGAEAAHGYIIFVNTSLVGAPVDGVPQSNDTDLSSTGGIFNVAHGTTSATFYNPTPGETYGVWIYPYTNSGEDIDYKTDGDVPYITVEVPNFTAAQYFNDNSQGSTIVKDENGAQAWTFTSGWASINGYSGGSQANTDWLILPQASYSPLSRLSFKSRWQYGNFDEDDYLKVLVSTDYDGTSAPAGFTWEEKTFEYSATANVWASSGLIDFAVGSPAYVAFKYNSAEGARRWDIDDILVDNVCVFEGSVNNDISDAANWFGGDMPESFNSITIDADLAVVSGTLECQNLEILPGAALTVNPGGEINVNGELSITASAAGHGSFIPNGTANYTTGSVQIFFANAAQWYYFSIPVTTAKASVMGDLVANQLYERNTAGSAWSQITDGNTDLVAGKGYAYRNAAGDFTATFTGTMANGTVTPPVLTNEGDNWWLLGNSYPSAIDLGTENSPVAGWNMADLRESFYIRTNGGFATYNWTLDGEGTSGGSRYIAKNQAVWVKVTGASPAFEMTNTVRLHNPVSFLKATSVYPKLRLAVANGSYTDETVIRFVNGLSQDFDKYDSEKKLTDDVRYAELYTLQGNVKLAINTIPQTSERLSMPLGFRCKAAGEFTITASEIENFGADWNITLVDNQTNKIIDLSKVGQYTFTSDITDNTSRFAVVFVQGDVPEDFGNENVLGITNNTQRLSIYAANQSIVVASPVTCGQVAVYDLTGKLIVSADVVSATTTLSMAQRGCYVVKVSNPQAVVTRKVFVK